MIRPFLLFIDFIELLFLLVVVHTHFLVDVFEKVVECVFVLLVVLLEILVGVGNRCQCPVQVHFRLALFICPLHKISRRILRCKVCDAQD